MKLPALAGVKATLKVMLWPAATVAGSVNPVTLKPFPVTLAWESVKSALPEFVTVIVCVLVLPTTTFPKATVDGTTESCDSTPVPVTETVRDESTASLTSTRLALTSPTAEGEKFRLNLAD